MIKTFIRTAALIALGLQTAAAQAVLENDHMKVELIGLKRWTIPMIQDSLRRYAPDDSLLSHACAAVLREKLKFADASVVTYTNDVPGTWTKPYLAVTVIEPEDSALIRYRDPFPDSFPDRVNWAPARRVFERHNIAFQHAIQRPEFLLGKSVRSPRDSLLRQALPLRGFLASHATPRDRELALATLAKDRNWRNRVVAALVLANFANNDTTWWALADALRDPFGIVNGTAAQVLSSLRRGAPRRVNWVPAVPGLRALLDGTNLFAHDEIMLVLAATNIDTSLARPLLKNGGAIIIAKLRSQDVAGRHAAHEFLVAVAGRDLGDDPDRWDAWLHAL